MNKFLLYFLSCTFTGMSLAQNTKITVKKLYNDKDSISVIEKELSTSDMDIHGIQMWMDSVLDDAHIEFSIDGNNEDFAFDELLDSIFNPKDAMYSFLQNFISPEIAYARSSGFLGVYFEDEELYDSLPHEGISISKILPHSAAEYAGLQDGDIVLQLDEIPIHIIPEATDYIAKRQEGDTIKIVYERDGRMSETAAVLKARPLNEEWKLDDFHFDDMPFYTGRGFMAEQAQPKLGLQLENLDAEAIEDLKIKKGQGVLVVKVFPHSNAQNMGFKLNDVITAINGKKVYSALEVKESIAEIGINKNMSFDIVRYGKVKKLSGIISEYNGIFDQN